jgi:hypothetical protein
VHYVQVIEASNLGPETGYSNRGFSSFSEPFQANAVVVGQICVKRLRKITV